MCIQLASPSLPASVSKRAGCECVDAAYAVGVGWSLLLPAAHTAPHMAREAHKAGGPTAQGLH